MNKIVIEVEVDSVEGTIPMDKIDELKDRVSYLMDVISVSYENDWGFNGEARIKFKGTTKRRI